MKLPNGMNAEINAPIVNLKGHFTANVAYKIAKQYIVKRKPWMVPTTFTASGMFIKYFNGMAMNKRINSELHSKMPITRKRPNAFFNIDFSLLLSFNFNHYRIGSLTCTVNEVTVTKTHY